MSTEMSPSGASRKTGLSNSVPLTTRHHWLAVVPKHIAPSQFQFPPPVVALG